jgi:NAD(P)-dependent dehydrogenase (short-subunit alcohol dehydrogenase family)
VRSLFARVVDAFGGVDLLVNNAGITHESRLADLADDDWKRVVDTNLGGLFLCSREAARLFAAAGAGRAVNVASVWGLLGRPGYSAYCASKGAVVNFTRSVAAEWARFGAQMNCVAPGYFATDINADLRADTEAVAKVLRRVPARRMGEPEELANLVTYLGLDAPDYLTGQTIALDGGESSV